VASSIVDVNPALLQWAIDISQKDLAKISSRFPRVLAWINGDEQPSFRQLEGLSNFLNVPFGYMFLKTPPRKDIVETEFRTISNDIVGTPSKELQDTLMEIQNITLWMRDYRIKNSFDKLDFVGCIHINDIRSVEYNTITKKMLELLELDAKWAKTLSNPGQAFNIIRQKMEGIGLIVIVKGFVKTNTHRSLKLDEFRAFVFSDDYAPTIFINSKDSENGRLFSLIHEFTHVLLGTDHLESGHSEPEKLCNIATINMLAPVGLVETDWKNNHDDIIKRIIWIAKLYKTSAHAMAIHLLNMGLIKPQHLQKILDITAENIEKRNNDSSGGDFWNTILYSMSPSFVNAVASQVNAGITQYTEAFRLLNIARISTYETLIEKVKQ
jgi:Zn-dependent peptidase ImmA (M78 family)